MGPGCFALKSDPLEYLHSAFDRVKLEETSDSSKLTFLCLTQELANNLHYHD